MWWLYEDETQTLFTANVWPFAFNQQLKMTICKGQVTEYLQQIVFAFYS
jgi:hypothetical protein